MSERLAIDGGTPIRPTMLPYGRQSVDETDIEAVVKVLRGEWLTTGPAVEQFETAFAEKIGCKHAVAVNTGTAALHATMFTLDIGPGDEVIIPALTFAASANCVLYQGGQPVFADVEPDTLLIDPSKIEELITDRTKAIMAVDYAGQPCDYDALRKFTDKHGLALVADACHALGARYKGREVGTLADLNAFSFHPVKHITTAEGGMVTTENAEYAEKIRWFRNHGLTTDHRQRALEGGWFYEMVSLGYNYRLPDMNCALGTSQLMKLDAWVERRRDIAQLYDKILVDIAAIDSLTIRPGVEPSWHIYPVLTDTESLNADRATIFEALRAENIGVNVHYIPVYWHPYYTRLGYKRGLCPIAEDSYQRIMTLPVYPTMTENDASDVINAITKVLRAYLA